MTAWISTDEYIPEDDRIVLVCDAISGFVTLARYDDDEDQFVCMHIEAFENDSYPTHWALLPPIPEVIHD